MHNVYEPRWKRPSIRSLKGSYIPLEPYDREIIFTWPFFEDVFSLPSWRAKRHVCQLSVLQYRYPTLIATVAEHMFWSYYAFNEWRMLSSRAPRITGSSNVEQELKELAELSLAVQVHDIRKPPWTPLTELYQKFPHEDLSCCEDLKRICEKEQLDFQTIVDTIKGGENSKYGALLECEINVDQLGYMLQELRLARSYGLKEGLYKGQLKGIIRSVVWDAPEEFPKIISFDEIVMRLLRCLGLVEEKGVMHMCICIKSHDDESTLELICRYKAAVVASWRRFVTREKDVIIETLTQHLLRRLFKNDKVKEELQKLVDSSTSTDYDFERIILSAAEESNEPALKRLAQGIISGYVVHDYDVVTGPMSDTLVRKILDMKKSKDKYRLLNLIEEMESNLRKLCNISESDKKVVAVAFTLRKKPYFSLTWDPSLKFWKYEIKVETRDGRLATVKDVNPEIGGILEELREKERMAYLHLVFPPGTLKNAGKKHFYDKESDEWIDVRDAVEAK